MEKIAHEVDTAPSMEVINAISEYYEMDPLDLDPLYEVIDLDALDALFTSGTGGSSGLTVQFSYNGCDVQVLKDGTVEVLDDY